MRPLHRRKLHLIIPGFVGIDAQNTETKSLYVPGKTAAAAAALHLQLHHRLVPPPSAGLTGVRRGGEPNLCVEVLVKILFSSRLS
jgi:hypothetical protein